MLLLVNRYNTVLADPNDENSEEVTLESPIARWKALLGDKNPEEAKTENPESLRALYG